MRGGCKVSRTSNCAFVFTTHKKCSGALDFFFFACSSFFLFKFFPALPPLPTRALQTSNWFICMCLDVEDTGENVTLKALQAEQAVWNVGIPNGEVAVHPGGIRSYLRKWNLRRQGWRRWLFVVFTPISLLLHYIAIHFGPWVYTFECYSPQSGKQSLQ